MASRKKWATRYPYIPTDMKRHPSKPATYRHVQDEVEWWRLGNLRSPHLVVYVDEGDGQGWQVYERIDLAELAAAAPADLGVGDQT